MSVESAKAYMERLKKDQEFVRKAEQRITDAQMSLAKEEGYTFTAEELKQVANEESTVTDTDLDMVSGGTHGGVVTAYVCNCCGLAMINMHGICRNLR